MSSSCLHFYIHPLHPITQLCDRDPVYPVWLFSYEGAVTLLRTSTILAEPLPHDEPTLLLTPGEVAVPVPSYESIARHQDGLGNEWLTNAHTEDGAVHLYEAVGNQDQSTQPFPVYGYVPTTVCRGEACTVL